MKTTAPLQRILLFASLAFTSSTHASENEYPNCGPKLEATTPAPDLTKLRIGFARRVQERILARNQSARAIADDIRKAPHHPLLQPSEDGARFRLVLEDPQTGYARLVEFLWRPDDTRATVIVLRELDTKVDRAIRHQFHLNALLRTKELPLRMSMRTYADAARAQIFVADVEHAILNPVFPPIERVNGDYDSWLMGLGSDQRLISVIYAPLASHTFVRHVNPFGSDAIDSFLCEATRELPSPESRLDVTRGLFAGTDVYFGPRREHVVEVSHQLTRTDVVDAFEASRSVLPEDYVFGVFWFAVRTAKGIPVKVTFYKEANGDIIVISAVKHPGAVGAFDRKFAKEHFGKAG